MVKRILHSLHRMINQDNSPETWDERLPMALLGLRTAPNATTKYSPAYLVYGRHLCLPAERRRLPMTAALNPPSAEQQQQKATHRAQQGPTSRRAAPTAAAAAAAATNTAAAELEDSDATDSGDSTTDSSEDMSGRRTCRQPSSGQVTPTRRRDILPTEQQPVIEVSSGSPDPMLDEGAQQLVRKRKLLQPAVKKQLQTNVRASQAKMVRDHQRRRHRTNPSAVMHATWITGFDASTAFQQTF